MIDTSVHSGPSAQACVTSYHAIADVALSLPVLTPLKHLLQVAL